MPTTNKDPKTGIVAFILELVGVGVFGTGVWVFGEHLSSHGHSKAGSWVNFAACIMFFAAAPLAASRIWPRRVRLAWCSFLLLCLVLGFAFYQTAKISADPEPRLPQSSTEHVREVVQEAVKATLQEMDTNVIQIRELKKQVEDLRTQRQLEALSGEAERLAQQKREQTLTNQLVDAFKKIEALQQELERNSKVQSLPAEAQARVRQAKEAVKEAKQLIGEPLPPVASITVPPTTVSHTITLTAVASSNGEAPRIDFFCDSVFLGSATSAPYTMAFDTTTISDGRHSIACRAVDKAGNAGELSTSVITVSNNVPGGR